MPNQAKYLDLIVRYLNHPEDDTLHAEILNFRNSSGENDRYFREMERIWQLSSKSARLSFLQAAETEKRFISALQVLAPRKSGLYRWMAGIAASILIIGGSFFLLNREKQPVLLVFKTQKGQTDTLSLADGSKIVLAENTQISYPERFMTKTRDVSLDSGRAFFLVAKDPLHAFRINMGKSQVSVLGTSFNLVYSKAKVELDVKTGRVMFQPYKDAVSSILSAGQGLSYDFNRKQLSARLSQNADAWMSKELNFVDTPLEEVCRQLSDYYGLEIRTEMTQHIDKKFNATFRNEDLDDVLQVLKQTYSLKIKKDGQKIILKTP